MFALDSYSLNAPAIGNRLTLEVMLNMPEPVLGHDYGIVDKGSYAMVLGADGRVHFKLKLRAAEKVMQLALVTPRALPPGSWHTIVGTFDGKAARLCLNGEQAAHENLEAGASIIPYKSVLSVNTDVPLAGAAKGDLKPYLLHSIRISNQAEEVMLK